MTTHTFKFSVVIAVFALIVGAVGTLNWLIDPLWYQGSNKITDQNYVFNERISKVNLINRTNLAQYDCLILGSSRLVGIRPSDFKNQRCFNLALAGAELPEMLAYGNYAASKGLRAKRVYVGIDDFNFILKPETSRRSNPKVEATPNLWHAYFSADVLTFSVMTLLKVSPDFDKYYDGNLEMRSFRRGNYRPAPFRTDRPMLQCDANKATRFAALRDLFPTAQLVAFAPPMSPWHVKNEVYSRGVLDCELQQFYRVAQAADVFWDFAIPSALTSDNGNTTDGTHFLPEAYQALVDQLEGRRNDLALPVKQFASADAYRDEVKQRLTGFFTAHDGLLGWQP